MQSMIRIMLLFYLICYSGCALIIADIDVKQSEYESIKNADSIRITTHTGKQYELEQFKLTDNQIIGKRTLISHKGKTARINF